MSKQVFTEIMTFFRCANWSTETCPHLKKPSMQLATEAVRKGMEDSLKGPAEVIELSDRKKVIGEK